MRKYCKIWMFLFALMSAGCTRALVPSGASATQTTVVLLPTMTPEPTATATQTPLPSETPTLQPTATPAPTATSVDPWGSYPGPSEPVTMTVPRELPLVPMPADTVNIIVLGSDWRNNGSGYRTDTMFIVSLHPTDGSATMLSIPRDLYVYLPGWRLERINVAEPHGGFELLEQTIRYNLGIELDHWIRVEFWGFEQAVNILGGLQVHATGNLNDHCGGEDYSYQSGGSYYMDGFTALCYGRMRKTSSDFDRLRRQQELMRALFDKVVSIDGLQRVPELYNLYRHTFRTDMTVEDVLALLPVASQLALDPARIKGVAIDRSVVSSWRVPVSGAAVLLPDRDALQALLWEAYHR